MQKTGRGEGAKEGGEVNIDPLSWPAFFSIFLFFLVIFKNDKLNPHLPAFPTNISSSSHLAPMPNFTLAHPLLCLVFPGLSVLRFFLSE